MKSHRHQKIRSIIGKQPIETQEELAEALRNAGFEVTQATVSRDIKEMGLVKIPTGKNTYRYGIPTEAVSHRDAERMSRMFRDAVVKIDFSENIIVIKTLPGTAQGVASTIDHSEDSNIIGTVAGDDTILVVVKPIGEVSVVFEKFCALMTGRV